MQMDANGYQCSYNMLQSACFPTCYLGKGNSESISWRVHLVGRLCRHLCPLSLYLPVSSLSLSEHDQWPGPAQSSKTSSDAPEASGKRVTNLFLHQSCLAMRMCLDVIGCFIFLEFLRYCWVILDVHVISQYITHILVSGHQMRFQVETLLSLLRTTPPMLRAKAHWSPESARW